MTTEELINTLRTEFIACDFSTTKSEDLQSLQETCKRFVDAAQGELDKRGPGDGKEGWLARQNDML